MDMIAVIAIILALFLLTQSWFWMLAFFLGGLAALFAMLASIIHFQIFGAVGFFLLMALCWGGMLAVAAFARDQQLLDEERKRRSYQRLSATYRE